MMTTPQSDESARRDVPRVCDHEDTWVVDLATGRIVRRACPLCLAGAAEAQPASHQTAARRLAGR